MTRILKYLKPFWPMILIAVALLFVQANADLALPDYMSRIVNVGIQQGGIENAVPEAISQTTFDRLNLFLTADEKTQVAAAYKLVEPSSAEAAGLVGQYPALASQAVYVLQTTDASTINSLNPVMGRALLIVSGITQIQADPSKAATLMPNSNFDLSKLPAGTDLFAMIKMIPEQQRLDIGKAVDTRFAALGGEKALIQAAATAVKAEYQSLGMNTGNMQTNYLLRIGGQMLLITLIGALATVSVGFLASRTGSGLGRNLRHFLFEKVMRFSGAEFEKFSTASLITRSTNDITQVQMVTMMLVRMIAYAPIIGIGGIIRALAKSPSMWWTIALAVVVLLSLIGSVMVVAVPKFKLIQSLIDRLNLVARENLSGMMVVRAFDRQKYEEQRFDQANVDLTKINLFVNRIFVIMMPMMGFIMSSISVLIIWVGSNQVAKATMQVGDMMAFMQYAMQIVFAFMMLSFLFILLPRSDVSANRIADVLETKLTILEPEKPKTFPQPFRGTVEFRNVSFRYPDAEEDVLHDINFVAEAGKTTALIGTTGSGKSTVINLIPRFYDVTAGAILVDGTDIREVTTHDLRSMIGYIPQQSSLFAGTIESNLRYGDENADDARLKLALEIAQAEEFVSANPDGYQASVAQGGVNFSGGQKQRLSIARALVKNPPIYIFDDSFSALDYKTDASLRRALKKYLGDSTVLIVSQRVATIKDADQILVLDEGRIIGKGTHLELMDSCEVYREIALSQLKRQEALA